jgi:hypothetical protein
MPTAYEDARSWMSRVGVRALDRIDAALELLTLVRPHAAGLGYSVGRIFRSEAHTAKMLCERAGLASLAARREMQPADILEAVEYLITVGGELAVEA